MILGVDHLSLSCEDVVAASHKLSGAGYRVKFVQEEVPNHSVKRPFLRKYNPLHAVAYCVPETGTALELTQHGSPLEDAASPYQVLLACAPSETERFTSADPTWEFVWRATLGCRQPEATLWSSLHAQFWTDTGVRSQPSGVRAVLVPVADAARSAYFWRVGLGCQSVAEGSLESGRRWAHVAFRAPFRNWSLDVILAEGKRGNRSSLLDSAGFTCLALLVTTLERDGERMRQAGALEFSGEFRLEVNNKPLRVLIVRGPDEELIELIELQRNNY